MTSYPKRLIEVDLPIKRISAHARREKSIRHGHISTLHIWWARRPLAACRAVICASLWPDPADENCPQAFRDSAARLITEFAEKVYNTTSLHATASRESFGQWEGIVAAKAKSIDLDPHDPAHLNKLRFALLDFIADFANWDNSTVREYLDTSRALTRAAHEALGGESHALPVVLDPFAGGGSIPLEALRIGAYAIASDINPIPVLLNRLVLEPGLKATTKFQDDFAIAAREVERRARRQLEPAFATAPGTSPIAYLWARTIRCEGPACGAEVPLLRTLRLSTNGSLSTWLQLSKVKLDRTPSFRINVVQQDSQTGSGTVRSGSVVCPYCGYTTPAERARSQLAKRKGGSSDARLLALLERMASGEKRFRAADVDDLKAIDYARSLLESLQKASEHGLSAVPDEPIPSERPSPNARGLSAVTRVGMMTFGDLYIPRQALVLAVLAGAAREVSDELRSRNSPHAELVDALLAIAVSKRADFGSSLCSWRLGASCVRGTFARQALSITWDFGEMYPFAGSAGDWSEACSFIDKFLSHLAESRLPQGTVMMASAAQHPLPDDSVDALITDPPYYDSVPYADLSDYFYVWLRRSLCGQSVLRDVLSPKDEEIIWNPTRRVGSRSKDKQFYEEQMTLAFREARRVTKPGGVGVVVFAHKSTSGWEAILEALIKAGWIATGSWPLETERAGRTNAVGTASLASSVHIVCRPRENPDGSVRTHDVGDWRDVLAELPGRIHAWMPRLAAEGVVGADAIFACLGPALEVFIRYGRVEKSDGSVVPLREYLEHVWAAVSKEALSMIFKDADASGLEPDARLTAMWLWTLRTETSDKEEEETQEVEEEEEEDEKSGKPNAKGGFVLEFEAARKIAQGLGANLEELRTVVEVKGQSARLLPVGERAVYLLGKPSLGIAPAPVRGSRKAKTGFLPGMEDVKKGKSRASDESGDGDEIGAFATGTTTLDWIHQSMLLFARGRSDALKRFLVDDGIGKDARFWKLAQSLSALYPPGTDEKRWVDGVLARKKGLGL